MHIKVARRSHYPKGLSLTPGEWGKNGVLTASWGQGTKGLVLGISVIAWQCYSVGLSHSVAWRDSVIV